jgi:hypothetical protein
VQETPNEATAIKEAVEEWNIKELEAGSACRAARNETSVSNEFYISLAIAVAMGGSIVLHQRSHWFILATAGLCVIAAGLCVPKTSSGLIW